MLLSSTGLVTLRASELHSAPQHVAVEGEGYFKICTCPQSVSVWTYRDRACTASTFGETGVTKDGMDSLCE